jgi:hypothetical protein
MGFIEDIFADVRVFTDEIQSLKEELVSSVIDPTGQLRSTVNEIAGEITGTSQQSQQTPQVTNIAVKTDDTPSDTTQPTE